MTNIKRIPVHSSMRNFLDNHEDSQLAGLVSTIIDNYHILVEGCVLLVFGVGGYYSDCIRELIEENL
jgi:hypothetical protein